MPNSKTMQVDVKEKLPFDDNSIGLINANLSIHYFNMETTIKNKLDWIEKKALWEFILEK